MRTVITTFIWATLLILLALLVLVTVPMEIGI